MVFSKKQAQFSMAGKHCLVTGGAQGIGLEICKTLIVRGAASVAVLDIAEAGLHSAAQDLRSQAGNTAIATFKVDVTRENEVHEATQAAIQHFGTLDMVFANAGIGPGGGILDRDASFYSNMIAVNFMGVVHTIKAALPVLVAKGAGNVIVTNSIAGFAGAPGLSAYSASKFAVRGLVESVRLELLGKGVSFHLAAPGFTNTAMVWASRDDTTPELQKLFDETADLMTPAGVGKSIVDGVEEGGYVLRSPNWIADFVINGCLVPRSPRPYHLFIDMILAPLYVLGHWHITRKLNGATQHILRCASASMHAAGEATRSIARRAVSLRTSVEGASTLAHRSSSGLHSSAQQSSALHSNSSGLSCGGLHTLISGTGSELHGRSSSGLRAAIDSYQRELLAHCRPGGDTKDDRVQGSAVSRSWVAVSLTATFAVAMIAAVMHII